MNCDYRSKHFTNLAGVLALHVQRARLGVQEVAGAAVSADVPRAVARVDLRPAEDASLQPAPQELVGW